MSADILNFKALPRLAIGLGDATPNPGKVGCLAFSTLLYCTVEWDGASWQVAGAGARSSGDLAHLTDAQAPARIAGQDRLYAMQLGTKRVPAIIQGAPPNDGAQAPMFNPAALETAWWQRKKRIWQATLGSTTPAVVGFGNTVSATTTANDSAGNISYSTAATAGSSASTSHGASLVQGGFFYYARIYLEATLPERLLVGMGAVASSNADPSAMSSGVFGFAKDVADGVPGIVYRDALTGSAIKQSTGLTHTAAAWYEVALTCELGSAGSSRLGFAVRKGLSGAWVHGYQGNGSIALQFNYIPRIWINNGTTAAVRKITVALQYLETDY